MMEAIETVLNGIVIVGVMVDIVLVSFLFLCGFLIILSWFQKIDKWCEKRSKDA